jgi:geranylgeranyl diphosphate synthase, type I
MADDPRARVDAALRKFVTESLADLAGIGSELEPVAAAAARFVLDAGKRLRPSFCFWGALAVGADDTDSLVSAAASLELLQACALVHDDVIDRSATRRGQPSIHEQFASLHASMGWTGDPAAFGEAAAILLGDLYLVWSDAMLASSGCDEAALRRARPIVDAMRVELMAGQYLDVVEQARGGGSVERALRVARFKAAKYTIERPLHLGAALGAGSPEAFEALSGYGIPLGEAFQLRDDLLGVFGDPALTGKPAGDDLREGKRTVLIALAVEATDDAGRSLIERHLGDPDPDEDAVAILRSVVADSGAATAVEKMIDERVRHALEALTTGRFDPGASEALVALASAATKRAV